MKGGDFMKSKKLIYISLILILSLIFIFSLSPYSFAGNPKIVNKLVSAFEKIEGYIVSLSTPVAAVAIGSGFLMQKFSFGDEERIRTGKKLIRISLVSYAFILLLDLLLTAIESLIG